MSSIRLVNFGNGMNLHPGQNGKNNPSSEEIESRINQYEKTRVGKVASSVFRFLNTLKVNANSIATYMQNNFPQQKILAVDIGCGFGAPYIALNSALTGKSLAYLSDKAEIHSVDVDSSAIRMLGDFHEAFAEILGFDEKQKKVLNENFHFHHYDAQGLDSFIEKKNIKTAKKFHFMLMRNPKLTTSSNLGLDTNVKNILDSAYRALDEKGLFLITIDSEIDPNKMAKMLEEANFEIVEESFNPCMTAEFAIDDHYFIAKKKMM